MSSLLVEVVKISDVQPIPDADRIELAVVKGWNCIIQKNQYKVGQLVTFIPPDSVLPDELIKKYDITYLKNSNGRIGTVKLRGVVSQGLILPAPQGSKEGEDVAKILGITKWEVQAPSYQGFKSRKSSKKHRNVNFSEYTDMNNIKHYIDVFEEGEEVVITEKVHGTNFRAGKLERNNRTIWDKIVRFFKGTHEFVYGSHHVQISGNQDYKGFYGDDVYGKIAKKYDLARLIPNDYVIYGEIYGKDGNTNIQDLTYGLDHLELAVFDVTRKGKYLDFVELFLFCVLNNLPMVPILYGGKFSKEVLQKCTDGMSELCPTQIREGCIVKPMEEKNHPKVGRKILKSVSVAYLTRKDGTEFK